MLALDFGFDPALNLGAPGAVSSLQGAPPQGGGSPFAANGATPAAHGHQRSFHSLLHDAGQPAAPLDPGAQPRSGAAEPHADPSPAATPDDQAAEPMWRPAELPQAGEPAWETLVQLVWNMIQPPARLGEAADTRPLEEQPEADAGEEGEDLPRFIDLLKQLQATSSANPAEMDRVLLEIRHLLGRDPAGSEGPQPSGLPGRIHQWLAQADAALSGIPWGRLAQLVTGQGAAAEAPVRHSPMGASGLFPTGAAAPEPVGHPELPVLLREALGRSKPEAVETREPENRTHAPKPPPAEPRTSLYPDPPRPVSAPPAPIEGQHVPDSLPATSGREPAVAPGRDAAGIQELPRSAETSRQTAPEASGPLTLGVEESADDGASAAILRGARTAPAVETAADRPAETAAMTKHREADGPTAKGDVVAQIIQRAAVHLKSDQGEARIDLKPEFLGQVRMHIVTDSQQVTVRIVAELPMVRDLIEQNLDQLKADLRQQGLQVERVEVSVADDPRRDAGRRHRAGTRRNGRESGEVDAPAVGSVEQRAQGLWARWSTGGRNTVDMFV
ncbi:MAG: flagellar hook-length control protein FliK [Desulfobacterales bacterium]